MNKKILVSAILLSAPAVAFSAQEISGVRASVTASRAQLFNQVFVSEQVFTASRWFYNESTQTTEERVVDYRIRMRFSKIQNSYEYDGRGKLDYEVLVESVVEGTGEVLPEDAFYFAKRVSGKKFRLFNCDSTSRCYDDAQNTGFSFQENTQGTFLRLENTATVFNYIEATDVLFRKVP